MKMDNFNIILFMCNWNPHTAFQTLEDQRAEIPPEIRMVRIPCAGRISKALLFKAFEKGADGVALVGCEPGFCRYGSGTATARDNTPDTREILEFLGLGKIACVWLHFYLTNQMPCLSFLKNSQMK